MSPPLDFLIVVGRDGVVLKSKGLRALAREALERAGQGDSKAAGISNWGEGGRRRNGPEGHALAPVQGSRPVT